MTWGRHTQNRVACRPFLTGKRKIINKKKNKQSKKTKKKKQNQNIRTLDVLAQLRVQDVGALERLDVGHLQHRVDLLVHLFPLGLGVEAQHHALGFFLRPNGK